MHHYLYAGRAIFSTIALPELPELPESSRSQPEFHISRIDQPVRPCTPPYWQRSLTTYPQPGDPSCARVADAYGVSFPGTAEVWIPTPGDVQVWQHPDASAESIRHVLLDHVMPRVLAHSGVLMLHGSAALTRNGACVVLLAQSGSGKSTLGAAIALAGGELLTDDCFGLLQQESRLAVVPTYTGLRLWPDSLQALFGADGDVSEPMAHNSAKRRMPTMAGRLVPAATAIDAIFVLDPDDDATDIVATPLAPADACIALVRNSFRLDLGSAMAAQGTLAQAARMSAMVPVMSLHYRRDYATLPTLTSRLESFALKPEERFV